MSRKKIEISARAVEEMARIGATTSEIATAYSCSAETIRKRFLEELARGRADRRVSLRRKQYDVAVKGGNVQMLIWLGKQDLGQTDKQTSDVTQVIVMRDETVDRSRDPDQPTEMADDAGGDGGE